MTRYFVEGNCACLDSQDLARLLHRRPRGKEVHNVALSLSECFRMCRYVLGKHTSSLSEETKTRCEQ